MAVQESTAGARPPVSRYVGRYGHTSARLVDPTLQELDDMRGHLLHDLEQLLVAIATGDALDQALDSIRDLVGDGDDGATRQRLLDYMPTEHRDVERGSAGALVDSAVRRLRELEDVIDALFALAGAPVREGGAA